MIDYANFFKNLSEISWAQSWNIFEQRSTLHRRLDVRTAQLHSEYVRKARAADQLSRNEKRDMKPVGQIFWQFPQWRAVMGLVCECGAGLSWGFGYGLWAGRGRGQEQGAGGGPEGVTCCSPGLQGQLGSAQDGNCASNCGISTPLNVPGRSLIRDWRIEEEDGCVGGEDEDEKGGESQWLSITREECSVEGTIFPKWTFCDSISVTLDHSECFPLVCISKCVLKYILTDWLIIIIDVGDSSNQH